MEMDGDQNDFPNEFSRRRFSNALEDLRNNAKTKFEFRKAHFGTSNWNLIERWKTRHARQVVDTLMVNTSVVALDMVLEVCEVSDISLFLDFIRSTRRLQQLDVSYSPCPRSFRDRKKTRRQYDDQLSRIFHAILQNPSIKKFALRGEFGFGKNSPQALLDLLSKTTSLTSFTCAYYDGRITNEAAFAVNEGLSRNSSLLKVDLSMEGSIDIAVAGTSSPIESLTVSQLDVPSNDFYSAISKVLQTTPSLKIAEIGHEDHEVDLDIDAPIDQVLLALNQSPCSGLEKLVLKRVCIEEASDIVSKENANHSLKFLDLWDPHFENRGSVRLLWNFVGLEKLEVCSPEFTILSDEDSEEVLDGWKGLLQRNEDILEVYILDRHEWANCAEGIVRGACGHPSLETLRLDWGGDGNGHLDTRVGKQIGRLLRWNTTLQTLTVDDAKVSREGGVQLTEGMFHNKVLQSLVFHSCTIDSHFMTTLDRVFTNNTLTTFDLAWCTIKDGDIHIETICRTLSSVFRNSTSLASFRFPSMDISAENMSVLVSGLQSNKTMTSIGFGSCRLDCEAWDCLERALLQDGRNKMSISSIRLPSTTDGGLRITNLFLQSLLHMPSITKVETFVSLDAEEHEMLLQAAKDKKTLLSFSSGRYRWYNEVCSPIEKEIDFYLKLNRFGRQILDYTNVHSSLWPILLNRMTSDEKDVDALYFFLREYFARGGGKQQPPSPQQAQPHPQRRQHIAQTSSRPSKLARLDYK